MATPTHDRTWIASEFLKLVELERSMASDAKMRAESPPMPSLAVLYHEIAGQDERHVAVLETIATRYGHTPTHTTGGGVGEVLGRLKDKVLAIGSLPTDLVRHDLTAKADVIHWQSAWVDALGSIGDSASSRDLAAVLIEDQAHHHALLDGLKGALVEQVVAASAAKVEKVKK